MTNIGSRFAALRKSKGYTQEKLAEILGITAQAISKWENGHTLSESSLLPALSKIYGCTIDTMLMPDECGAPTVLERQTASVISKLEGLLMNKSDIGLDDNAIIQAVHKIHPNITDCFVRRADTVKRDRSVNTKISVEHSSGTLRLIEKVLFGESRELSNLALLSNMDAPVPTIYHIDRDRRLLLIEDLSTDYISGFCFDEDNEQGVYYREHLTDILFALAALHLKCWDNYEVFGKIGLPWHLENIAVHLKSVEKDYLKFKKANSERLTDKDISLYDKALELLKCDYPKVIEERFHKGRNITVIHGDFHPGNTFVSRDAKKPAVRMIDLEAVRMGLATEDLAMFLALHTVQNKKSALPLLEGYYAKISKKATDYSFAELLSDYKLSTVESLFFPIRLINGGIKDFHMQSRSLQAFEDICKQ